MRESLEDQRELPDGRYTSAVGPAAAVDNGRSLLLRIIVQELAVHPMHLASGAGASANHHTACAAVSLPPRVPYRLHGHTIPRSDAVGLSLLKLGVPASPKHASERTPYEHEHQGSDAETHAPINHVTALYRQAGS